jgi:Ca2+-binding EF-hand superfamily protein
MIGIEELMQIFNHFDGDNNGRIDRGEFKRLMQALGADAPDAELDIGFEALDSDGSGHIEFNEFGTWWMNR